MNGIFDIPRPITSAATIHASAINEKNKLTRVDKRNFYPERSTREKNIVTRSGQRPVSIVPRAFCEFHSAPGR
jgi:hypothetical protein